MMPAVSRPGILVLALSLLSAMAGAQADPTVNALGALVMDADSGRILFSKNADLRLHPASTTKIMTGLLLAEKCRPDEMITAPPDVKKVKESSMHLEPGEWLTADEMMYALMLRSANDGCHTVALHIAGSEAAFADLMNQRAKEIGCTNTTFVNPHGLTNAKHLTTAHDLALMAREAMRDPMFAKVVGTQKHVVQRSLNLKDTLMENHDKWLWLDPRAKGVKTGWTKPAGHCFVGYATDNGMNIITVILKSDAWIHDQQAMVDWAFKNFEMRSICNRGGNAGVIRVLGGEKSTVQVEYGDSPMALLGKSVPPVSGGIDPDLEVRAPVRAGTVVGSVTYGSGADKITVPLIASEDVAASPFASVLSAPGGIVGFVVLAGCAFLVKARSRRMVRGLG